MHFGEAAIAHRKYADFVGRAEAVLDGAQDTELVAALAFEVEHGIDHVFEHARAGDVALLGDMPDQYQDKAPPLGHPYQLLRRAAHLADAAGSAVEHVEIHRLDRNRR